MKSRVLLFEPSQRPVGKFVEGTEAAFRELIGGRIGIIYAYGVEIIFNEDGIEEGFSLNRALRDDSGQIFHVIAGTFIIGGPGYSSISPKDEIQCRKRLGKPDLFVRSRGIITVL